MTAAAHPQLDLHDNSLSGARAWFARKGLSRPRGGRILAGVCASFARRYDVNPLVARLSGVVGHHRADPARVRRDVDPHAEGCARSPRRLPDGRRSAGGPGRRSRADCLPWTTPGSRIGWRRSRRCSSSPTRTPTTRARIAAPPRRSAARRSRSPTSCAPAGCASCAGSARGSRRGCASSSRRARSPSWPSSSASSRPAWSASAATSGSGRKRSVDIARALGVHTAGGAARGSGGRAAADRAGDRAEDRGAAARGARARATSRGRSAGCCSTAPGSSWAASRPRSGASRPATCGAGATRASGSRWSAPAADPASGAGALRRRCRRSSR